MRVSIETTSGLERKVTVAVPSESFEEQIEKRLRSTAREAQLPGFRRGKVPVKEIRRRFGTSLRQEVAVELVESSYNDMVNQENLNPAGQPAIELVNIEADADLEFVATVEVLPEVELADFHTLRIGQPEAAIAASDVDAMVQNLREQRVAWTAVERPAAAQDRVRVDYTVQVDGKAIDDRARPRTCSSSWAAARLSRNSMPPSPAWPWTKPAPSPSPFRRNTRTPNCAGARRSAR